jgi:hypothetical protein
MRPGIVNGSKGVFSHLWFYSQSALLHATCPRHFRPQLRLDIVATSTSTATAAATMTWLCLDNNLNFNSFTGRVFHSLMLHPSRPATSQPITTTHVAPRLCTRHLRLASQDFSTVSNLLCHHIIHFPDSLRHSHMFLDALTSLCLSSTCRISTQILARHHPSSPWNQRQPCFNVEVIFPWISESLQDRQKWSPQGSTLPCGFDCTVSTKSGLV